MAYLNTEYRKIVIYFFSQKALFSACLICDCAGNKLTIVIQIYEVLQK